MRFWIIVLLLSAQLAGCGPRGAIVQRDTWTGARSVIASDFEIHRQGSSWVTVRPLLIELGETRQFGVWIAVNRDDVNGPLVDRVTFQAIQLPYRRIDRLTTGCPSRCTKTEIGFISLSQTTFELASETGLPLRIWGVRGRYEGTVPANAFDQVLAQVDADR